MTTDGVDSPEEPATPVLPGPSKLPVKPIHPPVDDRYFGRFGTFLLGAPCETPPHEEIRVAVEAALKADPRVSIFRTEAFRPEWVTRQTVHPSGAGMEDLLSEDDHFHVVRFKDAFIFEVTVPKKNQPLFRGEDDIPAEKYFVAWNGVTALVLWKRPEGGGLPSRSGGHVVISVLADAVAKAGLIFYPQACSPGCTNVFAHRVMRIERFDLADDMLERITRRGHPQVDVHLHMAGDDLDVAKGLLRMLSHKAQQFAMSKNVARRLLDLESASRTHVDDLLQIQSQKIQRKRLQLRKRPKEIWAHRKDPARSRELVADLWIALARSEALKRDWDEIYYVFSRDIKRVRELYRTDLGDDAHLVNSLDTSFIRAAIEQAGTRRDTRIVAISTLAGGAAGVVGAVVGSALS